METLNILLLDRDMYETTYKNSYVYVFNDGRIHTASYINKCLRSEIDSVIEVTRDARFYGEP